MGRTAERGGEPQVPQVDAPWKPTRGGGRLGGGDNKCNDERGGNLSGSGRPPNVSRPDTVPRFNQSVPRRTDGAWLAAGVGGSEVEAEAEALAAAAAAHAFLGAGGVLAPAADKTNRAWPAAAWGQSTLEPCCPTAWSADAALHGARGRLRQRRPIRTAACDTACGTLGAPPPLQWGA